MSTVESIARPRRNGERRRAPTASISKESPAITGVNFFSDKLVLTSVTPASSAPVLQTPKATSSTLYFDSLTVNAGNGGFLHCIHMDTSVNAANQLVSVGADIALDADPKFFACLIRFESSSAPTTLPTASDVYPFDGRQYAGIY